MGVSFILFLLSCLALSDFTQAQCDSYNCDGYCCGYDTCCYSIYLTWWFWLIVVGVFLLKVSCITCYVRRRRQRANMYYVPAPIQTNTTVRVNAAIPQARVPTAPAAYPHQYPGQQVPPPYPGPKVTTASAPPYTAVGTSQGAPMSNGAQDSRVNKDTEMLIG